MEIEIMNIDEATELAEQLSRSSRTCTASVRDGRVVFTGGEGELALDLASSDRARVCAAWNGYSVCAVNWALFSDSLLASAAAQEASKHRRRGDALMFAEAAETLRERSGGPLVDGSVFLHGRTIKRVFFDAGREGVYARALDASGGVGPKYRLDQ
jgi:hypothetical protein